MMCLCGLRKANRWERVVDIHCKAIIPPPGTKNHNRLPRAGDPEPSQLRRSLLLAGLSVAVLAGRDNRYETLLPLAARLLTHLPRLAARTFVRCDG